MEKIKLAKKSYSEYNNLDIILNKIITEISSVVVSRLSPYSLILVGSLARGEAMVSLSSNGLIINSDIEMFVICSQKKKNNCNNLSSLFSKKYGVEIDLIPESPSRFQSKDLTISNYDLKNNSIILFGRDYRPNLPKLASNKLPNWEGIRLIFNRISELMKDFNFTDSNEKLFNYHNYWINKLVLASLDSISILKGNYRTHFKNKIKKYYGYFDSFPVNTITEDNFFRILQNLEQSRLPNKVDKQSSNIIFWKEIKEMALASFSLLVSHDLNIKNFNHFLNYNKYISHEKVLRNYSKGRFTNIIYQNAKFINRLRNSSFAFNSNIYFNHKTLLTHLIYYNSIILFDLTHSNSLNQEKINIVRNNIGLFIKSPIFNEINEELNYLNKINFQLWEIGCK